MTPQQLPLQFGIRKGISLQLSAKAALRLYSLAFRVHFPDGALTENILSTKKLQKSALDPISPLTSFLSLESNQFCITVDCVNCLKTICFDIAISSRCSIMLFSVVCFATDYITTFVWPTDNVSHTVHNGDLCERLNVLGLLPECLTAETEYWTKSNVSKIQSLVVPLFEQIKKGAILVPQSKMISTMLGQRARLPGAGRTGDPRLGI